MTPTATTGCRRWWLPQQLQVMEGDQSPVEIRKVQYQATEGEDLPVELQKVSSHRRWWGCSRYTAHITIHSGEKSPWGHKSRVTMVRQMSAGFQCFSCTVLSWCYFGGSPPPSPPSQGDPLSPVSISDHGVRLGGGGTWGVGLGGGLGGGGLGGGAAAAIHCTSSDCSSSYI